MDIAYDHIQEEALSPSEEHQNNPISSSTSTSQDPSQSPNLNAEFQQAFKAVSSSPWGSTLSAWFSSARKQGETFYQDLQKEAVEAQEQATKGFTSLREQVVSRTRSLSIGGAPEGVQSSVPGEEALPLATQRSAVTEDGRPTSGAGASAAAEAEALEKPESLPADIVKEAGTLVASLRSTAALKLKDLQRAEDAADEALLKFGTNVRNFLRDAVTVSAPESAKEGNGGDNGAEVLFETQEPGTGKKVFHSTRLDAQLHAIHTTATSFTADPQQGDEWDTWSNDFDVEKKTNDIAKDLERYEELRRAMEKLVPEKVEYATFWKRYYFLRKAVEEEEKRRREVLKGMCLKPTTRIYRLTRPPGATTDPEEEVTWDDDDDDEKTTTPNPTTNKAASESTTTLHAPATTTTNTDSLKPPRTSEDGNKSVADSDASYDIVSGTTSRAASSPKEEKLKSHEESDDDDWE